MPLTSRVPGYEITEVIHEAENTTVYRAKLQKDNLPAILKVILAEFSTLEQINRLKREFKICENLNLEGVVKVYGLETSQNHLILVMEDFGGISLKDFLSTHTLSLEIFLLIALQLAESLASLHAQRIIHKDIKPSNIIINPQTLQVKITDFSIAARFQDVELDNSTQLEGTLSYISPEQTGRINRKLDYRTDFYSLGITFYELLTGQLPFFSNDPLEIVYGHTAKEPKPIRELNQNLHDEIPETIASIITKLMAKNPDARYQNASELLADLQQCLNEWQTTGKLTNNIVKSDNFCRTLSTTTSKEVLDLATVIKATSAISSEIVLDKLLLKLLHIIIENASAQIGCIILERDNELFIEVADTHQDASLVQLQSTLANTSSDIPISIIDYVATNKQPLVLTDASQEGIFLNDPYILNKKPKSILCTPIFYHSKFLGVVYLENNHYTGAFTQERLQILQVLTSQAASAIENARLFSAEQQYRNLVETSQDVIWSVDASGKFTFVNSAVCNILGYQPEEMIGRVFTDFQPEDQHTQDYQLFQRILAGESFLQYETSFIHKDGNIVNLAFNAIASRDEHNKFVNITATGRDITQRKLSENLLKKNEQFLRTIYDGVSHLIFINDIGADGKIYHVSWNKALEKLSGAKNEDLYGKTMQEVFGEAEGNVMCERLIKCAASANTVTYEEYVPIGGQFRWFLSTINPLQDETGKVYRFIGTTIDITDRKNAEAEIKQKEEQYRGIFETVTDGIAIIDIKTQKLLAANPAYHTMHGYTYEEFIQLNPLEYIHPNSHHLFSEFLNTVKLGKSYNCQATDICKDGTLLHVEVKGIPYLLNNKLCILSVVQDITERKRTLEELSQRSQELEQTLLKLQHTQSQLVQTEKISQLGQLVAGVAHEVNNPVSFINGNLTHAKQYIEDLVNLVKLYQQKYPNPDSEIETEINNIDLEFLLEDLPKLIISMKLGTDRIRDIMQSLRNFSRSDTGEKIKIDIHKSIDTTLIVLSHRLKAKPERPAICIIKEYGQLPLVPCFSGQINQVFMNLLANAIDALEDSNTGKTYLEIDKNPNKIKITTELVNASTPYIQIKITDNGLGMTEEVREKLFNAFFTTKVEGKGTGLGLSISNQIITEAHNGKLECFSSPGEGAEFVIKLPLTN